MNAPFAPVALTGRALVAPAAPPRQTVYTRGEAIVRVAAIMYGIPVAALRTGRGRRALEVLARRYAIWRLRHELHLPVLVIARMVNRDHSTVVHHLGRMAAGGPVGGMRLPMARATMQWRHDVAAIVQTRTPRHQMGQGAQ